MGVNSNRLKRCHLLGVDVLSFAEGRLLHHFSDVIVKWSTALMRQGKQQIHVNYIRK